jgi:uncharacterized surface protein with fasciclin (FAS1) repeats
MTKIYHIIIPLCLFIGAFLPQCGSDQGNDMFYKENELQITSYLAAHADTYSTLLEVLQITGIQPALNAYGHFTFFAPDNDAFAALIAASGHTSVKEFDVSYLTTLVKYHLINKEVETSYLPDGVLADTTWSGDNLVFDFGEGGLSNLLINGKARIKERDIRVANGFINRIDQVIDPVFLSVFDQLEKLGNYSIFTEALTQTGYADTLKRIYIPIGEDITVKSRFTLFCEPDEIFQQSGIGSFDDLKAAYSNSDDLLDPANGLHQFVGYHCLPDIYYLNQLDSFNYITLAENKLMSVKPAGEIWLNFRPSGPPIMVLRDKSNIPAKNGVIHAIDNVMEVIEPSPAYFRFDLTSYPGLELGKTYTSDELKQIGRIRSDKTGLWFRMSVLDEDSSYLETTTVSIGWTVEFTVPPMVPGKYKVTLHWVSDQDRTESVQTFWDGDMLGPVFSMRQQKRPPMVPPEWLYDFRVAMDLGTVILDETRQHNIKFFALSEGLGEFDYLSFTPE